MTLKERVGELRKRILSEHGPRLSALGHFPFAIVHYAPEDEFEMRDNLQTLASDLRAHGWKVYQISLIQLLIDRLEATEGAPGINQLIELEKRKYRKGGFKRSLAFLTEQFAAAFTQMDAIAEEIIRRIEQFYNESQPTPIVVFLTRAGALYPFYRTSVLLHYLDGKTHDIPVILLYPGTKTGPTSLAFMGESASDHDYRPDIL